MPRLTTAEFMEHIREQLKFLIDACNRFDGGEEIYFKQIALQLRVLLHHTASSHALLEQIDKLQGLRMLDSAGPMSHTNLLTISGLAELNPSTGEYYALGGAYQQRRSYRLTAFGKIVEPAAGRTLKFAEWWIEPVTRDNRREVFTRRDLVLAVANQDGGAHVDPDIKEAYYRLSRSNSLAWERVNSDGTRRPFNSPVPASIRQIAHEALHSVPHTWHTGAEY